MKPPAWLDIEEYPFAHKFIEVSGGKMHYLDEGEGTPIVMVHGTPAWSFLYRKLVKHLSGKYRCIVPDHIGFGLSDKPGNWTYTPQAHAANLETLIQTLALQNIILVVHDFGGPIGLSYAVKNAANVSKIIVLNTWMWSLQEYTDIQKKLSIINNPLIPFLYKYFNFSAQVLLPKAAGGYFKFTRHIHRQYTKPLGKPSQRMGTLAFAKALLTADQWFAELWNRKQVLAHKPALIVWGMKDKFIDSSQLERWKQVFSQAEVIECSHSGHWLQEEEPDLPLWIEQFLINK